MARNTVARIEIPLDIADVDVVSTRFTRDGKLLIRVESRIEATRCGCCGQEIRCNYGHGQEVRLRHLSVFERETYICLRPKRGQCQNCLYEPTTTQQLSWYEQRSPHTLVYDRYLMKQLVNSTIEVVSLKEGVGYDAIVGVLQRQVSSEVDWDALDDLGTVGIDEIAMSKGRKSYTAVITARQKDGKTQILGVLTDRKNECEGVFGADTGPSSSDHPALYDGYVGWLSHGCDRIHCRS